MQLTKSQKNAILGTAIDRLQKQAPALLQKLRNDPEIKPRLQSLRKARKELDRAVKQQTRIIESYRKLLSKLATKKSPKFIRIDSYRLERQSDEELYLDLDQRGLERRLELMSIGTVADADKLVDELLK